MKSPSLFLIGWLAACQLCIGAGTWNGVAFTAWNGVAISAWNGTGIGAGGGGFDKTSLVVWLDFDNSLTNQHNAGTHDATSAGTSFGYTTDPFGDANGALNCSSTATSWAYISAANSNGLDPASGMSLVWWGKDADAGTGTLYALWRYGSAGNRSWYVNRQTGTNDRFALNVSDDGTNIEGKYSDVGDYTGDDAAWHHWAVTFNESTNTAKYYRDGSLVDTVTFVAETGGIFGITTGFGLVFYNDSTSNAAGMLDGAICRFSLWHRELSGAEISTLYNSGGDTKYADL